MKKIKYLLLVLLAGVLVTGCGGSSTKTIKCSNAINNGGLDYTSTYEIVVDKNDYVKEVTTTEILKSEDADVLSQAKDNIEEQYSLANQKYGGYKYSVSISGNTLTAKCTIDYSKLDVQEYINDTGLTTFADSDNNVSLSTVLNIYKALGAKCEN